jgi:germination protein YpeB
VQVCEERGKVTAFDAAAYLRNHRERPEAKIKLSLGEAQAKLNRSLTVESSRLAVIPVQGRKEKSAYEFLCTRGETKYFVYLSAETGEELEIVVVTETDTGRYLR